MNHSGMQTMVQSICRCKLKAPTFACDAINYALPNTKECAASCFGHVHPYPFSADTKVRRTANGRSHEFGQPVGRVVGQVLVGFTEPFSRSTTDRLASSSTAGSSGQASSVGANLEVPVVPLPSAK